MIIRFLFQLLLPDIYLYIIIIIILFPLQKRSSLRSSSPKTFRKQTVGGRLAADGGAGARLPRRRRSTTPGRPTRPSDGSPMDPWPETVGW